MLPLNRSISLVSLVGLVYLSVFASASHGCESTCQEQCAAEESAAAAISDRKFLSKFLLSLEGKYNGVSVCLLVAEFQQVFMKQSLMDFCAVAGCTPSFQITSTANWYDDVKQDLTYAKMCDGYIFFGSWMPEFAAQGLVEPLGQRVKSQPTINWLDVYPAFRESATRYKDEIYTVPLDGDVIEAVYRDDLLEAHSRTSPRTFTELADEAEFFHGKDLNGDGEPDFGVCFSTKQGDNAGRMFWAAMSPFLQTAGTEEGVFFNPDSMEPKMREPIFRVAMKTYKRLVLASPFASLGETGWVDQNGFEHSLFDNGRCAFTFNFPGPVKMIISQQGGAKGANLTGKLSVKKLPGVACSDLVGGTCLHTEDGVNYAPFYAGGGANGQIRASSEDVKKDAMFDYMTWLSDPEIGFHITANPGTFLDPLRASHVAQLDDPSSPVSRAFLEHGWELRQLPPLKDLVEDVFSCRNAALPIRIPGGYEYTEVETVKHLVQYWSGTQTLDATIDSMVAGWNSITEKYGLENQRLQYREGLGIGPYIAPASAADEGALAEIVTIAGIVGSILVVLFCFAYLIKRFIVALNAERRQRRDIERRARENFMDLARLNFNMMLISYRDFVKGGALIKFEHARERGLHVTLDTYTQARTFCQENVVVFVSHQWLGKKAPDPQNAHFEAACTMFQKLIQCCDLCPHLMHIWMDYSSIPQMNKRMQHMAISSIQVYATLPQFFVCLVPEAKHELGHTCDANSYLGRGWCRLEQWARVSVGGLDGMYTFTATDSLCELSRNDIVAVRTDQSESWLQKSIQVCKGEFTDPEDRNRITGTVSALWLYALLTKDKDATLFNAVESIKDDVFPAKFFPNNHISIVEGVAAHLKAHDWEEAFFAPSTEEEEEEQQLQKPNKLEFGIKLVN